MNKMLQTLTAFLTLAISMELSASPHSFWNWLKENEARFVSSDLGSDFSDELSAALARSNQDLVWEFTLHANGTKEIIISADGIREQIPAVNDFISLAPNLKDWKFTAFRPRMVNYETFALEYDGREFDPNDLWFSPITESGHFDLVLFHKNYTEDSRDLIIAGTYILLDIALGEYDVMTGIRYIDHQRAPPNPIDNELVPFDKLRDYFDAHTKTSSAAP